MADFAPLIAVLLNGLNTTANPFDEARGLLKAAIYPATRTDFRHQILVLFAGFAWCARTSLRVATLGTDVFMAVTV